MALTSDPRNTRSSAAPPVNPETSTSTPRTRSLDPWPVWLAAALLTAALWGGCASAVTRVSAHTVPELEPGTGLVAVALIMPLGETVELFVDGPVNIPVGRIYRGTHVRVYALPAGDYCSAVIFWIERPTKNGEIVKLEPCFRVQAQTLTYGGHYVVSFSEVMERRMARPEIERALETSYPELLARYPLQ